MAQLLNISHPILTEYVLKLLHKQKLLTVVDLIKLDSDRLVKITNLSYDEISKLKTDLIDTFGVPIQNAYDLYMKRVSELLLAETGISSLDGILGGGFLSGNLIEICGLPGSGKTQLVNTIALHFSRHHSLGTYYIDTKKDFSGIRLHNILSNQGCNSDDISQVLNRIKYERCYAATELLKMLKKLLINIEQNTHEFKLLILDSLPALWFLYYGEHSTEGFSMLCELAGLLKRIATEFEKIILIVNLATTQWTSNDNNLKSTDNSTLSPALGKPWFSVPSIRLLIHKGNNKKNVRTIKIIKSNQHETGKNCLVRLTDIGVIT